MNGRRPLLALTAVTLVASCGTQVAPVRSAGIAEPPLGPVPVVTDPESLTLPLQAAEYSATEIVLLDEGSKILRARCAERFGVESTDESLPDLSAADSGLDRHYGVADMAVAAVYGYHPSARPEVDDKGAPTAWNPSAEERSVMLGIDADGLPLQERPTDDSGAPLPAGGCAEEAASALGGGEAIDNDLLTEWANRAWSSSQSDSRTVAATRAWSSCMEARGYAFESVWDANNVFRDSPVSEEEIAQATADVRCRQDTNLVGIWNAVETAYQQELIDGSGGQFARMLEVKARQLASAAQLVEAQANG